MSVGGSRAGGGVLRDGFRRSQTRRYNNWAAKVAIRGEGSILRGMMNLADFRQTYERDALDRDGLVEDPLRQFERWFAEASGHEGIAEANAMTLSTIGLDGAVCARVVLLKGCDADGFRFFTNYESRKGRQIFANPQVALSFYWAALERQVIINGRAQRLAQSESADYFRSRPRESQIGAWASRQSEPVGSRADLEAAFAQVRNRFEGTEIPIPPFWGGFLVKPTRYEFWQGRSGRLHDRFCYEPAGGDGWSLGRLQP